jgi:hypothetical protein
MLDGDGTAVAPMAVHVCCEGTLTFIRGTLTFIMAALTTHSFP